jgi:ATP-dependent DNA helicase DinG
MTVHPLATPPELLSAVRNAFSAGGVLSRMVNSFRPRPGQSEMAEAIALTLVEGGALVIEAGTGIGKTYAYLVPALLSGNRLLVSTATKTLQDQLFERDLPGLVQALGLSVRTALLKGRASYLCQHRLSLAREQFDASDHALLSDLARVEVWSQGTRTGDLAELPGLDERSPLNPAITSTRDNCLGSQCPSFRACHVNQARRDALAADIVVVNHHLFFADLAVRESGLAELLPTVQTVIFDEAHGLNDTGAQFLGQQLSTGQWMDVARDLLIIGARHARGWSDWPQLAADIEGAARDWRLLAGRQVPGARLRWLGLSPETLDDQAWQAAMDGMALACQAADDALQAVQETGPELLRLAERLGVLMARLAAFRGPCQANSVRWLEVGTHLKLVETPLDIAETVQARLIQPLSDPANPRSWIFTSATLGNDDGLTWFTEPCGLVGARILKIDSPFDYASQAGLYVPAHLPRPSDPGHGLAVADVVVDAARILGGRTLVLTTSLRALQVISEALQARLANADGLTVLVQGQGSKRQLTQRFLDGNRGGQAGCVLIASASFWEGVDIPGSALQMVVIDKLPFPSPGDPLVEARSLRLEQAGRNVFRDYALPETSVVLKQGAGRLIRHESDRGVLVVCDTRLTQMGYGRRLLASLPTMRRIDSEAGFLAYLEDLTKISTMAHPSF